jgi:hypothetical protein
MDLRADEAFGPGAGWVTVAPTDGVTELVLQESDPAMHGEKRANEIHERIGQGTTTVVGTEDCEAAAAELQVNGVTARTPKAPRRASTSRTAELEANGVRTRTPPAAVPWGVHTIVEGPSGIP